MSRKIAESLGMTIPASPYDVAGEEVLVAATATPAPPIAISLDVAAEDAAIDRDNVALENLVAQGATAVKEILRVAVDAEPRSRSSMTRSASEMMRSVVEAIKQKQATMVERKQFKLKQATGAPQHFSNVTMNTVSASFSDVLKMIGEKE